MVHKQNASITWRSIVKVWDHFKGVETRINTDVNNFLSTNRWLDNHSRLIYWVPMPRRGINLEDKITYFILPSGIRNFFKLRELLPPDVVDTIVHTFPIKERGRGVTFIWKHSRDGILTSNLPIFPYF